MGTNYYYVHDVCSHCGRGDERLHIGKSSLGWVFALHVYPELGINDLPDWYKKFDEGLIVDEYGNEIAAFRMMKIITQRSFDREISPPEHYLALNLAILGPNGLLRSKLRTGYVLSHGAGTWDCHQGDFS